MYNKSLIGFEDTYAIPISSCITFELLLYVRTGHMEHELISDVAKEATVVPELLMSVVKSVLHAVTVSQEFPEELKSTPGGIVPDAVVGIVSGTNKL